MPTLEQLFNNKSLPSQGGKTAKEAYDIQNSKDIRISTADPFVNTVGMSLARLARKGVGIRGSETLLEEELTGARLIRFTSMPFIYGSELPRILLKTTSALADMKIQTSGELSDTGALGGKISSAVKNVKTALGFPILATPTYVTNELKTNKYKLENVSDRITQLTDIKKSAGGTGIGPFLKGLGGGDLKTIGRQALGSAIKLGKKEISKKLFGDGKRKGKSANGTKEKGTALISDSETKFTDKSIKWWQTTNINYGGNGESTPDSDPSMVVDLNMNNAPYSTVVKPKGDTPADRNDLSLKQQLSTDNLDEWREQGGDIAPIVFSKTPDRLPKFSNKINKSILTNDFIEKKRGMSTISDIVNSNTIFEGETLAIATGGTLDEKDFVPLKFHSVHRNKTVQFRATLSGLSETFSPSWDSHKFIGSPFSNYTYGGISRSATFNFKVYSLNAEEHKAGWDKINFLNSLVYPQGYYDSSAVVPPFIKLTIGDLYKGKLAFIESLSNTWEDGTPWNVTDTEPIRKENTNKQEGPEFTTDTEIDMKGYRLPFITDVSISVKFLSSRNNTSGKKFYSFEPQNK